MRTLCTQRASSFSWLGADCASSLRLPASIIMQRYTARLATIATIARPFAAQAISETQNTSMPVWLARSRIVTMP